MNVTLRSAIAICVLVLPLCARGVPIQGDTYQIQFTEPLPPNPEGITELTWSGTFRLGEQLDFPGQFFRVSSFSALIGQCFADVVFLPGVMLDERCTYTNVLDVPVVSGTPLFDATTNRFTDLVAIDRPIPGVAQIATDFGCFQCEGQLSLGLLNRWVTNNFWDWRSVRQGTYVVPGLVSIPEPSSLWLLAIGLLFTAAMRRVSHMPRVGKVFVVAFALAGGHARGAS